MVNEHTQSSVSGLHYGFYKAAAKNEFGSEAHALQLTLVGRSGVPPPRWFTTMQLLLAKGKGECLASNNRYLDLYEGDFNEYKSHVVGGEAMDVLISTGCLAVVHHSKCGSTSVDCKFDGTLMVDICRQSRLPMILASVDAEQCYDRVLHMFLLLIWIALLKAVLPGYVVLMTLQMM